MVQDPDTNPYRSPQSSLSPEREQEAYSHPQKAGMFFRFFAAIIGFLMVLLGFRRFEVFGINHLLIHLLIMTCGVQFLVASLTGHWYSWFGRRL